MPVDEKPVQMLKRILLVLIVCALGGAYAAEWTLADENAAGDENVPLWDADRASPDHKKQIIDLAAKSGFTFDTRDRIDALDDLRSHGIDVVPSIRLGEILEGNDVRTRDIINPDQMFPIGGISNSQTILCNESGEYVTYDSDEHGFRNPRGIWDAERIDLAVIGESFAGGDCVSDGKGFADVMRAEYPLTLNLGTSGEGPLLQLAALREYLQFHAPKIVLWVYSEGIDLPDLNREARHPLLRRYLERNFAQGLQQRQSQIDIALRRYAAVSAANDQKRRAPAGPHSLTETAEGFLKLRELRAWYEVKYGEGNPALRTQSSVGLFSDTLAEARDTTASWGGTLYFVYLPGWNRYRNGSRFTELERTTVLTVVEGLHIPFIDVSQAFQSHGDPLSLFPFRRFGHYNDEGNRIVADAILNELRRATTDSWTNPESSQAGIDHQQTLRR